MIALVQENQQLFILSIVLLLLIVLLWLLPYAMLHYAQQPFTRAMRYWIKFKQNVRQNKHFIQFKKHYPKFSHFLFRRLQRQYFNGLPLTLFIFVMGYIFALFSGLVEDVVTSDTIVTMDHFVSQQMNMLRESSIVHFFILITSLASTAIACLVVFLVCALCVIIRQPYILIGLLLSALGSSIFTFLSKLLFHRLRPTGGLLLESSYSFPSGHATISIALYGFIAYVAIRFSQNYVRKVHLFFIAVLLSILVGLSRIVLNEHYLSDVLGGFLVGALWLTVAISVTEWLSSRAKITWQIPWSAAQIYLLWFSVACVLIAALIYAQRYQFPLLH